MSSYKDLIAWQKAMALALSVYRTTKEFPKSEIFGITAQLRRCAVSVPSNIAEGHGRITRGEWQQFLAHARGSLLELQTQLMLSLQLEFRESELVSADLERAEELGRILNGLLNSTPSLPPRKPFN